VALPDSGLEDVAGSLKDRHGVQVFCHEMDLTEKDNPAKLHGWVQDRELSIRFLFNNAGTSYFSTFELSTLKENKRVIRLNIDALTAMTYVFLPDLKNQEKSYLLNVASLAGFFPMPCKAVYAASKAYVLNFTRALRQELKGTSVSVSALCPGGVYTSTATREVIKSQGFFGRISSYPPAYVAKIAMQRLLQGRAVINPGWMNGVFRFVTALAPTPLLIPFLYHRYYDGTHFKARSMGTMTEG
jgi:short-subunit dehydrogenase